MLRVEEITEERVHQLVKQFQMVSLKRYVQLALYRVSSSYVRMCMCACMPARSCVYTYKYMRAITINKKEVINLKKGQGEVYEEIWREEKKERNVIIL